MLKDLFTVFRKGKELANAATWKNRTIAINALAALLAAAAGVASALGYPVMSAADAEAIAAGVVAVVGVVNAIMHVATSSKVGIGQDSVPLEPPAIDGLAANAKPVEESKTAADPVADWHRRQRNL